MDSAERRAEAECQGGEGEGVSRCRQGHKPRCSSRAFGGCMRSAPASFPGGVLFPASILDHEPLLLPSGQDGMPWTSPDCPGPPCPPLRLQVSVSLPRQHICLYSKKRGPGVLLKEGPQVYGSPQSEALLWPEGGKKWAPRN